MISSNDFRTGTTIELDGQAWRVVEFQHVKPGKGSAFVRTKLKNVQSGAVNERTFRAGEMLPSAVVDKSEMQFLYPENENYIFMNMESYDQSELKASEIGPGIKYLKEGMTASVLTYNGAIIGVELPNSVVLEVAQTDPGVRGDTATGGLKPAILSTGASIQVPLFVTIGDKVKVDTRSDTYLGREQ
ncbi:elongation factor P [Candidatus Cyanaurora vandensis]|uniref:elongation factor P n=1 Tax=Candidatus Cyanaurora vandensis TaxID=2714958 RepID=UPI002579BC90|nr:elongation factor P [Candidatus Cyanaurora vandensis]